MDLSHMLAFLPEPQRTYALAALYAFLATQIAASALVAVLPAWAFKRWRVLRVLSWYAHLAPRDAAGTIKLPFSTPRQPGAMEDLARLRAQADTLARAVAQVAPQEIPAPQPSKVPPGPVDHSGERGTVRVGALLVIAGGVLLATIAGAVLTGCPSPRLPAVEGCTVGASRCRADRPQVCSSTGRWHDVGDLACAASGAVCAEGTDGGVARCVLVTDGDSDAR